MDDDTLRLTVRIADELLEVLEPVGNFFEKKVAERLLTQAAGNIYAVPERVANLLPTALHYLGYKPGDPAYDNAVELQEAFNRDPLAGTDLDPDKEENLRARKYISDNGTGPDPKQTTVLGIVDP